MSLSDDDANLQTNLSSEDTSTEDDEFELNRPPNKLFTDKDDNPINFFIHESIKKEDTRQTLQDDIEQYGGQVVQDIFEANTVLVHRKYPPNYMRALQTSYGTHENPRLHEIFVEFSPFVRRCILRNKYYHARPVFDVKGVRGVYKSGWKRVDFTEEDDNRLAGHIATCLPDKEMGGRLAIKFYTDLILMGTVNPELCGWALRHSAESWRQRYKRNRARFDRLIEQIVRERDATQNEGWSEEEKFNRRVRADTEESYSEESTSEEEEEEEEEDGERRVSSSGAFRTIKPPTTRKPDEIPDMQRAVKKPRPHNRKDDQGHHHYQQVSREKGKARAKQQRRNEEDLNENMNMDIDHPEFLSNEPGRSTQNRMWAPERYTLVPKNKYSTQDTLVSTQNKPGLEETPSHQDSNAFPVLSPWLSPKVSSHPLTKEATAPQALSSPPRNRGYHSIDIIRTLPTVPPVTPPSNPKGQAPRLAARPPRELLERAKLKRSGNQSVENSNIQQAVRPNEKEITKVTDTSNTEDDSQHPIRDTSGKGKYIENYPVTDKVEHSQRPYVQQDLRSPSLETDDAEIARNLRTNQSQSLLSGAKALKDANSHSVTTAEVLRRLQLTMSQHGNPGPGDQIPTHGPFTPTFSKSRARSTSSAESFPCSGTKASAYKKQLQERAKQTPYQPPPGTHASQLTR